MSRFRSRAGFFLYGKLRQTDCLPVGDEKEDEVLKRGLLSETSDEDEIGIEHIGMDNVSQDGVFDTFGDNADVEPNGITDDFNPCVAEMASVFDGEVLHAEPALDGDFDGLSNDCGLSPVDIGIGGPEWRLRLNVLNGI